MEVTGPFRFQGSVSGRRFIVGEVELLDPAIETRSGDPQQLGGARFIAAGLAQSGLDQPAFDFGQQFVERLDRARLSRRGIGSAQMAADRCGQVVRPRPTALLREGRGRGR